MCQLISFFHRPDNGDISVAVLDDHSVTQKQLNLNENLWREGHYLPDGTIECRVIDADRKTQKECNERMRSRFPTFISFFNWCIEKTEQTEKFGGSLGLNGLTSAKFLTLPKTIGGYLGLDGLTSAKFLTLPKTIGGSLGLDGLTSAKFLTLPKTIRGSLYLWGLTSAKFLTLSKTIGGSLYLNGLTSAKFLTLPKTIGGYLGLNGDVRKEYEKNKAHQKRTHNTQSPKCKT